MYIIVKVFGLRNFGWPGTRFAFCCADTICTLYACCDTRVYGDCACDSKYPTVACTALYFNFAFQISSNGGRSRERWRPSVWHNVLHPGHSVEPSPGWNLEGSNERIHSVGVHSRVRHADLLCRWTPTSLEYSRQASKPQFCWTVPLEIRCKGSGGL